MEWIFTTALSRQELSEIHPHFDRSVSVPPQLVYAGRLSAEKGLDTLIRAIAILKKSSSPLLPVLTLAGGGPQRAELEKLVRDVDCIDQIRFVGQVNRAGLSQLLNASDFAVQPSYTEGLSKAWLDEMAHGLPLIASSVGAAAAVLGGRWRSGVAGNARPSRATRGVYP
jgi:glycosyltransferase involved in cell wall biosynthesis